MIVSKVMFKCGAEGCAVLDLVVEVPFCMLSPGHVNTVRVRYSELRRCASGEVYHSHGTGDSSMGTQVIGGSLMKYAVISPPVLQIVVVPLRKIALFHFSSPSANCQVVVIGRIYVDGMNVCLFKPSDVENFSPAKVASSPLDVR